MINFTLQGDMPSKKNAWKRGANGNVYIPKEMQSEIDAFLWQLKPIKVREGIVKPLEGALAITCHFTLKSVRDLDNVTTTLLDILQKAGIIINDSNVQRIETSKRGKKSNHPHVEVWIEFLDDSHE